MNAPDKFERDYEYLDAESRENRARVYITDSYGRTVTVVERYPGEFAKEDGSVTDATRTTIENLFRRS